MDKFTAEVLIAIVAFGTLVGFVVFVTAGTGKVHVDTQVAVDDDRNLNEDMRIIPNKERQHFEKKKSRHDILTSLRHCTLLHTFAKKPNKGYTFAPGGCIAENIYLVGFLVPPIP